jgi:hypothetical protein
MNKLSILRKRGVPVRILPLIYLLSPFSSVGAEMVGKRQGLGFWTTLCASSRNPLVLMSSSILRLRASGVILDARQRDLERTAALAVVFNMFAEFIKMVPFCAMAGTTFGERDAQNTLRAWRNLFNRIYQKAAFIMQTTLRHLEVKLDEPGASLDLPYLLELQREFPFVGADPGRMLETTRNLGKFQSEKSREEALLRACNVLLLSPAQRDAVLDVVDIRFMIRYINDVLNNGAIRFFTSLAVDSKGTILESAPPLRTARGDRRIRKAGGVGAWWCIGVASADRVMTTAIDRCLTEGPEAKRIKEMFDAVPVDVLKYRPDLRAIVSAFSKTSIPLQANDALEDAIPPAARPFHISLGLSQRVLRKLNMEGAQGRLQRSYLLARIGDPKIVNQICRMRKPIEALYFAERYAYLMSGSKSMKGVAAEMLDKFSERDRRLTLRKEKRGKAVARSEARNHGTSARTRA